MSRSAGRLAGVASIGLVGLVTWLAWPAAAQSRGETRRSERTEPARAVVEDLQEQKPERPAPERPRPEIQSVRFEATVFQVQVAKERVADLDAKALAAAGATPGQLAKALQDVGLAQILYRVDQAVALGSPQRNRIEVAKDAPYVTGTATTPSGQQATSIARQKVGAKFDLQGWYPDEKNTTRVSAVLQIDLALVSASGVHVGTDTAAPMFWQIQQTYSGVLQLGQPAVVLTADGGATSEADKPLAFVTLIKLSDPNK